MTRINLLRFRRQSDIEFFDAVQTLYDYLICQNDPQYGDADIVYDEYETCSACNEAYMKDVFLHNLLGMLRTHGSIELLSEDALDTLTWFTVCDRELRKVRAGKVRGSPATCAEMAGGPTWCSCRSCRAWRIMRRFVSPEHSHANIYLLHRYTRMRKAGP